MSILKNYDNTSFNKLKFRDEEKPYVVRKVEEVYDVRKDDVVRVSKAIIKNPKFASNQALLRTIDPNNIVGKKKKGRALLQATTAVATTVAQTAIAGTGTRLIQESEFTNFYLDSENRGLLGRKKLGAVYTKKGESVPDQSIRLENQNNDNLITNNQDLKDEEKLEPRFTIRRLRSNEMNLTGEYRYREDDEKSTVNEISSKRKSDSLSYQLYDNIDPSKESTFTPKYTGFPLEKENKKKKVVPLKVKYSLENRLQTVGLYSNDIINKSDVYDNIEDVGSFQLIPFRFTIYPDTNPEYLYFRAYLDTFSDSFGSTWNGTQYVGRAEEFYNYQSFTRDINFDFKVAAESKDELVPLYKKLNRLVGSTSPSYSTGGTFMRGVFSRITIGDYLQNIPGFFKSVNLTWNTNYPWEVGIDQDYFPDDEVLRNPHVLNVSINYTPVHTFNPEYGQNYLGVERNA